MKKVLILGCGDVGTALARILSTSGIEVTGVRRTHPPGDLPYRPISLDVCDSATLSSLGSDYDAVVYAVAADRRSEEAYRAAYVEGLRSVVRYFERSSSAPRFIFVSSTGVYAQSAGEWVDEQSVCHPQEFSGRLLREGEELLQSSSLPATILRLGGIYGPDRVRLITMVREGTAKIVENHQRYTNRIHRDDAARLLQHLLQLKELKPLYLGVDDEPCDASEVYAWLAAMLKAPSPERLQWNEQQKKEAGSGKRCSNKLIKEEGFSFSYPTFREGYTDILSQLDLLAESC